MTPDAALPWRLLVAATREPTDVTKSMDAPDVTKSLDADWGLAETDGTRPRCLDFRFPVSVSTVSPVPEDFRLRVSASPARAPRRITTAAI